MGQVQRPRSTWKERDDGSTWSLVELNGLQGIVAVIEQPRGKFQATVLLEMPVDDGRTINSATEAAEAWLSRVGARLKP